jgi:hypothetical protein
MVYLPEPKNVKKWLTKGSYKRKSKARELRIVSVTISGKMSEDPANSLLWDRMDTVHHHGCCHTHLLIRPPGFCEYAADSWQDYMGTIVAHSHLVEGPFVVISRESYTDWQRVTGRQVTNCDDMLKMRAGLNTEATVANMKKW